VIYARQIAIPHQQVKEVFAELGVDLGHYEVTVQLEAVGGPQASLYLSEDASHTNYGPLLCTNFATAGTLMMATSSFVTDKDRVYLYNADSADDMTVAVALTGVR